MARRIDWPKDAQYLVESGDRFASVSRVTSALGDYLLARILRRDPVRCFGITEEASHTFGLGEGKHAQSYVDTIHPNGIESPVGETLRWRSDAQIAHDKGWT